MITREQVVDLREGDVVRIVTFREDGSRYVLEGPVKADEGTALSFWDYWLRSGTGGVPRWVDTLTVVSRAPRPLYVNHPRTEPVSGDVVRDADTAEWNGWLYLRSNNGRWLDSARGEWFGTAMPARLRLLVDGETGQIVPDREESR